MSLGRTRVVSTLSIFLALVAIMLCVATTASTEEKKKMADVQTTESGLQYVIIAEGTGDKAVPGKKVKVHYTGKLEDGTEFDSSLKRGQPIEFTLGAGQVIKGWDEGIALMKVGDKRQLIIPPQLGYGAAGAGNVIPPNATIIFDVELVDVEK